MTLGREADPNQPAAGANNSCDSDLLSALAGFQAQRCGQVAQKARRVVATSQGVLRQQKVGRQRQRVLALAALLVFLMICGPMLWWLAYAYFSCGHYSAVTLEFSLWISLLGMALLVCVVLAGWMRGRR